ncbi:MAG: hypothetical protein WA964_05515, partial [Ilumatobacter sp.]|uniref:hypothetical protein n=1 Tax=Ilumatobacter sp. TaxID=1967498 RepID=UPI003C77B5B7
MHEPAAEVAVPFPDETPPGYEWLEHEPIFDPAVHLDLQIPTEIVTLTDLGYTSDEIAGKATTIAATSPFRVLSDEGAAVMLDVGRRLREFCRPAGERIERTVRGGCYRSRWLRDLCLSVEVTQHLADIYGTSIAPHPMVAHLGHLNYEPSRIETAVDKWHHDTIPLDFVMMVTDPAITPGGRFEYFLGTKAEAAAMRQRGETPSRDRVVAPDFPGPGSVIALHGDMVVHRGGPLTDLAERITMVNAYVATDTTLDAQSRNRDLIGVDDPEALYTEWAKSVAWRSASRLERMIARPGFSSDFS